jgi:hypothetical protein
VEPYPDLSELLRARQPPEEWEACASAWAVVPQTTASWKRGKLAGFGGAEWSASGREWQDSSRLPLSLGPRSPMPRGAAPRLLTMRTAAEILATGCYTEDLSAGIDDTCQGSPHSTLSNNDRLNTDGKGRSVLMEYGPSPHPSLGDFQSHRRRMEQVPAETCCASLAELDGPEVRVFPCIMRCQRQRSPSWCYVASPTIGAPVHA